MATTIHVLGIAGSIRRASWNVGLLRAAAQILPEGMTLEVFDLGRLPFYNQDLELTPPEPVVEFKNRLRTADALLIATPEYNYSIPAVLKNALDWASRPVKESPLNEKPAAIMGAGGRFGTVRAQLHLRQIAVTLNLWLMTKPELIIQAGWEKFDADGNLTDEPTRDLLRGLLVGLNAWTRRLKGI